MKYVSAITLIILMLLPWQSIDAREKTAEIRPMTLRECLLYARDHAYANRINRMDIEAAAADWRISASDLMPYVAIGSNGSLSFGRNIDPETNTYDNKKTLGTGFGLEMSLPLFDGLVRINNLKALKAAEQRKRKAQEVDEDRISLEVIRCFYNITYCKAMVEQMKSQLNRDSADLVAVSRQQSLGTKSEADVAELEAIVATDRYELINQQNLLKKADLTLRTAMGMPLSDDYLEIVEESEMEYNVGAVRTLPEIEEARIAVKESQIYLRAAKGGYCPRISFNAGISTSYYRMMGTHAEFPSFSRQFRDNMGEYLGLSFSFTVFDGLANLYRVKRATIRLRESETRLEQILYQISQAAEEANLDHESAIEELAAAGVRVEAERIAYKATRRKYELGAVSAIELYTSSSRLAQAEANLIGKRIQQIIAEIIMRYYLGFPLIEDS